MTTSDSGKILFDNRVAVAGPSSSLTVPGVMVSQIVRALAEFAPVDQIEMNGNPDFGTGLTRAVHLVTALDGGARFPISVRQRCDEPRRRSQCFRERLTGGVSIAVAFIWPTLDTSWVRAYLEAAHDVGAVTFAVCVSLPGRSTLKDLDELIKSVGTDYVIVGDRRDVVDYVPADEARAIILEHPALTLRGRSATGELKTISAFLRRDDVESLRVLCTAFDALPEAWADQYQLNIVMRHDDASVPRIIDQSYHSRYIHLIETNIDDASLAGLCAQSSVLIVADPASDSRAFALAKACGIATVVLATSRRGDATDDYTGGLLADDDQPLSIYVAINHGLRLAGLRFPRPESWNDLAATIFKLTGERFAQLSLVTGA